MIWFVLPRLSCDNSPQIRLAASHVAKANHTLAVVRSVAQLQAIGLDYCYLSDLAVSLLMAESSTLKKRTTLKEYSRKVVSLSLLAQINPNKKTCREFSLGMSEWTLDCAQEESDKENSVYKSVQGTGL